MLAYNPVEFRSGNLAHTEGGKVSRHVLSVIELVTPMLQVTVQRNESDLRGVTLACELRFREEDTPAGHAIKASREHAFIVPDLYRMRMSLHFGWVIPGAVVVALIGLFYLPFLLALPSRSRLMFFGAGLLYVGGALGMEVVGGKLLTLYGEESFPYQLAYCIEEIMEILGATLFAASLLGHLKRRFGGAVLVLS